VLLAIFSYCTTSPVPRKVPIPGSGCTWRRSEAVPLPLFLLFRLKRMAASRCGSVGPILMFPKLVGEFFVSCRSARPGMRIDLDQNPIGRAAVPFSPERAVAYAAGHSTRHNANHLPILNVLAAAGSNADREVEA
jgi:hypothetical protein